MGIIEDREGQLMLLAGFIIAIGLVITTVILNSVLFEGNVAVGAGNDPSKIEIVNLMQIAKDETRAAYRNATNSGTPASFTTQTQNFMDNLSTTYALNGEGVNLSWNVSNWINGNNAYFTDNGMAGGATNWTVIQNVNSSNITVNITTGTLNITISNTSTAWSNNVNNVTGYSFFNSTDISSNVSPPYSIIFINGANATGNYNINGTASGKTFIRARDYILYVNVSYSTSRVRADITLPVTVPW